MLSDTPSGRSGKYRVSPETVVNGERDKEVMTPPPLEPLPQYGAVLPGGGRRSDLAPGATPSSGKGSREIVGHVEVPGHGLPPRAWQPGIKRTATDLNKAMVTLDSKGGGPDLPKGPLQRAQSMSNGTTSQLSSKEERLMEEMGKSKKAAASGAASGARKRNSSIARLLAAEEVHAREDVGEVVAVVAPKEHEAPSRFKNLLIMPRSPLSSYWDLTMALALLFTALVTPFEVAFLSTSFNGLFVINRLVDVLFLSDMFITFCRPYQTAFGEWVTDHRRIARNYLASWFFLDLVSIMPFDVLSLLGVGSANLKIVRGVRLIRLVKLLRILRAGRMFQRWESALPVDYMRLELIKFMVIVVVLAHWMACGWHMMSVLQEDNDGEPGPNGDWIVNYGFVEHSANAASRYLVSVYWSIATLSTLGYGDVVPTTDLERVFVVIATVVGSSVYAYMIGNVCGILSSLDEKNAEFCKTMSALNDFMKEKRLPQWLKESLREFFRFRRNNSQIEDYHHLLKRMSPELRSHVSKHVHSRWIEQIGCFRGAPSAFMSAMAMCLNGEPMAANERVYLKGDEADKFYIVEAGVVMAGPSIAVRGRTFGEDVLYRQNLRRHTAGTLTHAVILAITKDELRDILSQFPEQRATMRKYVMKSLFRQAVHSYVRLKKWGADKSVGGHIDEELIPAVYQEKYRSMDHAEVASVVAAVIRVQRAGRAFLAMRRKINFHLDAQRRKKGRDLMMKLLEKLHLHHLVKPLSEQGVSIELLNRYGPTSIMILMGCGLSVAEADRVVQACLMKRKDQKPFVWGQQDVALDGEDHTDML